MFPIPIIIPMGDGPVGPLGKWGRRYVGIVTACTAVGFVYGNYNAYDKIQNKYHLDEVDPFYDYVSPVVEGTLGGALIGLLCPVSFPGIAIYQFMTYNRRYKSTHR